MMDSTSLNEKIAALDNDEKWGDEKPIPYIGWFWRNVDLDAETHRFGIIPAGTGSRTAKMVGFMQNNKWDYSYTRATTPEEWTEIRRLIVEACEHPSFQAFGAVRDAITAIPKEAPDE